MVLLKVDPRITERIKEGVEKRHRSMFIIIGDKSRDQIVNLHHLLTKAMVAKSRPSVLWCYKNKLDISSHWKKRGKEVKRRMKHGLLTADMVDPFLLFAESGGIKYCMCKDSERVLGNTFGMCILQDFEALTPNLLARTIETVEGGGLIILLLHSLTSLTSLYTMAMDVHERFRTESHSEATGRFNERFLLSVASCKACLIMDDELNVIFHGKETGDQLNGLSILSHNRMSETGIVRKEFEELSEMRQNTKNLKEQLNYDFPVGPLIRKCCTLNQDSEGLLEMQQDLKNLKEQHKDDFPVGPLIRNCCTLDQGNAIKIFLVAILGKAVRNTVALLAARGRGKSAALGLSIAGAVAAGYSNIFVTAPSPENLKTLFEFVVKGLDALGYKEHMDYDVVKCSNSEYKKAIVQLNIYKEHRQTIQYIKPHEHEKLSQVELLVVDEAAAIPLPVVKSLFGPYLVFLSTTVSGYEGTGRSLSLKLLQQLEEQSRGANQMQNMDVGGSLSGRNFNKVELGESIRYASSDPIESWLHGLLCLDVAKSIPPLRRLYERNECDLYYVNRDTLFSYHMESEKFMERMMALFVASHYKNSPNDLQLMADAPAHRLFVLLGRADESSNKFPDILCVIQVCLEGQISRRSALKSLSEGHQPYGDQIPWKFCEQFQDTVFPTLSGARIVRIAVHPNAMRMGYGSTAVELLTRYYEGQLTPIRGMDFEEVVEDPLVSITEAAEKASTLKESLKPRKDLPALLVNLCERTPEKLDYIGASFGLTLDLFRFWRKHKFAPFYVGQIQSAVTGEHTCMVIRPLNNDDIKVKKSDKLGLFTPFYQDFRCRFRELLCSSFKAMDYKLSMSVLDPRINFREPEPTAFSKGYLTSLSGILSPCDMKWMEIYTSKLADFHLILDLVPILASEYFQERLPVTLSFKEASMLLCMGLKNQDVTCIEREIKLKRPVLSHFMKIMEKFHKYLQRIALNGIESNLRQCGEERVKVDNAGLFNPELPPNYVITDSKVDCEKSLQSDINVLSSSLTGMQSSWNHFEKQGETKETYKTNEKRSRDGNAPRLNKKRKH